MAEMRDYSEFAVRETKHDVGRTYTSMDLEGDCMFSRGRKHLFVLPFYLRVPIGSRVTFRLNDFGDEPFCD